MAADHDIDNTDCFRYLHLGADVDRVTDTRPLRIMRFNIQFRPTAISPDNSVTTWHAEFAGFKVDESQEFQTISVSRSRGSFWEPSSEDYVVTSVPYQNDETWDVVSESTSWLDGLPVKVRARRIGENAIEVRRLVPELEDVVELKYKVMYLNGNFELQGPPPDQLILLAMMTPLPYGKESKFSYHFGMFVLAQALQSIKLIRNPDAGYRNPEAEEFLETEMEFLDADAGSGYFTANTLHGEMFIPTFHVCENYLCVRPPYRP